MVKLLTLKISFLFGGWRYYFNIYWEMRRKFLFLVSFSYIFMPFGKYRKKEWFFSRALDRSLLFSRCCVLCSIFFQFTNKTQSNYTLLFTPEDRRRSLWLCLRHLFFLRPTVSTCGWCSSATQSLTLFSVLRDTPFLKLVVLRTKLFSTWREFIVD